MRGEETLPPDELRLLSEQMWPGCDEPDYQVLVDEAVSPGWVEVERHWSLGRRGRVTMLLPPDRRAAAAALSAYSRLRPPTRRVGRLALACGVATGAIRPRPSIALAARAEVVEGSDTLLQQLRAFFGTEVAVAMHLRRTANRKALLQVVDRRGRTLGYAKLARDTTTGAGVRRETEMLTEIDGGRPPVRAPRVLTSGTAGGMPYVLTEPLPAGLLRATTAPTDAPSISEFVSISPLSRGARAVETAHVHGLLQRVTGLDGRERELVTWLERLLAAIDSCARQLPVAHWWHGDLAFWNVGRAPDGTLWCWDFENAAPDALAGLDVIHWHASRRRARHGADGLTDRAGILADTDPVVRAYGTGCADALLTLYRVYVAEIVTRTLEMAAADGWGRVWCTPDELAAVARAALD